MRIKLVFRAVVAMICCFGFVECVFAGSDCQNWAAAANLGGAIKYDPAIFASGGKLIVVAIGTDNALWANEFSPAANQNEWYSLKGGLISGPSVTDAGAGKFTVSAFGNDNAVWQMIFQSSKNWIDWRRTDQTQLGSLGPDQAILNGINYRVVKQSDNSLKIDKCVAGQNCIPGAVSGCKVCQSDGSGWRDKDSNCPFSQICQAGVCKNIANRLSSLQFAPQPYAPSHGVGCADYMDLFNNESQWKDARKKVDIFYLYGPLQRWFSETEVSIIFSKLNQWGVNIALEEGAVKDWGCAGEVTAGVTIADIDKIESYGAKVSHISMDEPFIGGQYVLAGRSCNQTMDESLIETVKYINLIKQKYPDIIIGDIEPYPYFSVEQLKQWIIGFKEKSGDDFPSFQVDIDYRYARERGLDIVSELNDLSSFCRARGIKFAIIAGGATCGNYPLPVASDKDFYESTLADAQWVIAKVPQDFGVVQSWGKYPQKCNSDSGNYTFSRLAKDFSAIYNIPDASRTNKSPIGFFDAADCSSLAGWACDPDDYAAALQVHFYADGPAGTGSFVGETTANLAREAAVGNLCGGRNNHGYAFSTPASLKDGRKHTIYVYAINTPAGNNPQLTDSPKTIVCSSSCVPNCVGKTRGDDGCGGNCGTAEIKIAGGGGGGGGSVAAGSAANSPAKMTRAEILVKIQEIKKLLIQLIAQLIAELQKQLAATR
ncbi:MAG TPA: hypothetical protein PLA19_02505 [Candidatus Pacearchaeota archaeon]|nr:hypothetical protein [Candidatus Pacearchaeota archaeon]